jgi:hypothetical protein
MTAGSSGSIEILPPGIGGKLTLEFLPKNAQEVLISQDG